MTADDSTPPPSSVPAPSAARDGLFDQLRQLEAFVARAEAEGDQLPAQATEMVARLKEIVEALDGLTSSLKTDE